MCWCKRSKLLFTTCFAIKTELRSEAVGWVKMKPAKAGSSVTANSVQPSRLIWEHCTAFQCGKMQKCNPLFYLLCRALHQTAADNPFLSKAATLHRSWIPLHWEVINSRKVFQSSKRRKCNDIGISWENLTKVRLSENLMLLWHFIHFLSVMRLSGHQ